MTRLERRGAVLGREHVMRSFDPSRSGAADRRPADRPRRPIVGARPARAPLHVPGGAGARPGAAEPAPRLPTADGLPEGLRTVMEAMSGFSLADVVVHRSSAEPARLGPAARSGGPPVQLMKIGDTAIEDRTELAAALVTAQQPDFLAEADEDETKKEIVDRLIPGDKEYLSAAEFIGEVRLRANIVAGMRALNRLENVGYNHEHDNLNMPGDEWEGINAYARGESEEASEPVKEGEQKWGAAAFKSTGDASAAIAAVFVEDSNEDFALECNTGMLLAQYHGLLTTLGEDKFNDLFPGGITLMREWLAPRPKVAEGDAIESQELIPTTRIATKKDSEFSQLVPGDGVYFANFEEYEDRHPEGAFAGEWGIYLGGGKFTGLGVEEMTFDEMVAYMIGEYNKDSETIKAKLADLEAQEATRSKKLGAKAKPKIPGGEKKQKREAAGKDNATIDGELPGISVDIRRMPMNDQVMGALADL
jgi:hypothetical protein